MNIREQIEQLNIEREDKKSQLFDLYAAQADAKAAWINDGISTPLNERLEREADIADLEAARQFSKVKLMKLKQQQRLSNEQTYRQIVDSVLKNEDNFNVIPSVLLKEINAMYVEQTTQTKEKV